VHGGPRRPLVEGLFTAGTGVANRGPRTTVKDTEWIRRAGPSLASVRSRLTEELPVRLVVTATPAASVRSTVAAAQVPFTASAAAARSYVPGLDGRRVTGIVAGLERTKPGVADVRRRAVAVAVSRAAPPVAHDGLRAGEVVVLRQPDASIDVGERRPRLALDGAARVVMLTGDGRVAIDTTVDTKGPLTVPPRVALVGVQARASVSDGLRGWHVTSRVASIGAHAFLGAGCVVVAGAPGADPPIGWARAGDVMRGAAVVTTTFPAPVRTIAIVLAGAPAERLERLGLEVTGGAVATGDDGRPQRPSLVMVGALAVVLYRLQPTGDGPMAIRVRSGGAWDVAGVLGGAESVDALSRTMAKRGPAKAAARLTASEGGGPVHVGWQHPAVPRRRPVKRNVRGGARGRR
jgi:hypothetical protein